MSVHGYTRLTSARIIATSSHQNVNADILLETTRSTTEAVATTSSALHIPMTTSELSEHMSCMPGRLHIFFMDAMLVAMPACGEFCIAEAMTEGSISVGVGVAIPIGIAIVCIVAMDEAVEAIPPTFMSILTMYAGWPSRAMLYILLFPHGLLRSRAIRLSYGHIAMAWWRT